MVEAMARTTPAGLELVKSIPETEIREGIYGEDGGWIDFAMGPFILMEIGKTMRLTTPDYNDLTDDEQLAVINIAGGSQRWSSHGEVYDYRVEEYFSEMPEFRAKFTPLP